MRYIIVLYLMVVGSFLFVDEIKAQLAKVQKRNAEVKSFVALSTIATSNNTVPFWMRSMQYGSIPLSGLSTSLEAGMTKDYSSSKNDQLFDWGAGAEARFNVGYTTQVILIEAYAKARLGVFQLKAGRSKDIMGLVDTTLSTGAFAVSGNALGIPKVEISIPEYWDLPLTNGLIAIKGNFAHGWFNEQETSYTKDAIGSYFHQKSLYGRIGKTNWKVKFHGGFNHQVLWGNEKEIFSRYSLNNWESFKYVFTGQAYGGQVIPRSKVGNHLGSLDQAVEIELNNVRVTAYHQFFYEAGALAKLANVKDGIWGISIKNKKHSNTGFSWRKILFEVVTSKSQGGEVDSKPRNSGAEDYYNNFIYTKGWSYKAVNIGNPLFTGDKYINKELPQYKNQYFVNNRIDAFHLGFMCSHYKWSCKTLLTYSNNYGTYQTSPYSRGRGSVIYHFNPPYFGKIDQFSGCIETSRLLKKGVRVSLAVSFDKGDLIEDAFGGQVRVVKRIF